MDKLVVYRDDVVGHLGIVQGGVEAELAEGAFFVVSEQRTWYQIVGMDVCEACILEIVKLIAVGPIDPPDICPMPISRK